MNRYFKEYNQLVEQALKTPSKFPGETHHILPRSIHKKTPSTMPVNAPENLVFLSHREHLRAHWLLFKMYEGTVHSGNMAAAFVCMINMGKTPAHPTPEQYQAYEEAKIAASEAHSRRMTGTTHSAETKAKISKSMSGRTGDKSSRFGKPKPEGSGCPSRPVINTETGEVWESVRECAKQLGTRHSTINSRIKRESLGGIWQFVEAS